MKNEMTAREAFDYIRAIDFSVWDNNGHRYFMKDGQIVKDFGIDKWTIGAKMSAFNKFYKYNPKSIQEQDLTLEEKIEKAAWNCSQKYTDSLCKGMNCMPIKFTLEQFKEWPEESKQVWIDMVKEALEIIK